MDQKNQLTMGFTTRRSVGIDIAKETFSACICLHPREGSISLSAVKEFKNSKIGFNRLMKWVQKSTEPAAPVIYLMEATGIYYEALAYHLHKAQLAVSVLLPNKVKYFGKSLNIKSKTDEIDARIIAQLGAEREVSLWSPPSDTFKQLRDLTRLYSTLKVQRTSFMNQRSSAQSGYQPHPHILRSLKAMIGKLEKEIEKAEAAIRSLINNNPWLEQKINKLLTIKGVGLITAVIILAETQGFANIKNRKQLASYAGYDVVQKQSGTSIKGKTRISKKGNSRIRAALHYPALVATQYNPELAAFYQRVNKNKPSKMIGATALQRKILLLLYTLWKNDAQYRNPQERQNSGNQKTKPLLLQNDETEAKKAGRLESPPAQDELPSNLSTEALLLQ